MSDACHATRDNDCESRCAHAEPVNCLLVAAPCYIADYATSAFRRPRRQEFDVNRFVSLPRSNRRHFAVRRRNVKQLVAEFFYSNTSRNFLRVRQPICSAQCAPMAIRVAFHRVRARRRFPNPRSAVARDDRSRSGTNPQVFPAVGSRPGKRARRSYRAPASGR